MIRINQIKLNPEDQEQSLQMKACRILKIPPEEIAAFSIYKKSIDARNNRVKFVYSVDLELKNEEKVSDRQLSHLIQRVAPVRYDFEMEYRGQKRPVIIGAGPAGLFCSLILAENGARPIVIERGKKVENRVLDVDLFWKEGLLDTESNIQFGEGGAGTFSDGKLNTLIKDSMGRGRKVLSELVKAGAPKEILYLNKPHVGTDQLRKTVIALRKRIEALGGEFKFSEKLIDLKVMQGCIESVITDKGQYLADTVIMAVGHSARDTFEMLNQYLQISQKPFSVGVRIEHLRKHIDSWQYGQAIERHQLPAADYKLVHHCTNGRSVYTFCMCPGGVVTGASSEEGGVVTNGMSYYARNLENSNSAVLVNVEPEDFGSDYPLAGIDFQRKIESKAFVAGGGQYYAPVQLFSDFRNDETSVGFGKIKPTYRPGTKFANIRQCFPEYVSESLIEGIEAFGKKIKGFDNDDVLLTGVEARSSSPIRLERNEQMEASIKGIYPIGEGAGYAGGIMSSAIDGIKAAEIILKG